MSGTNSSVIVKKLGSRLGRAEVWAFRQEMQRLLDVDQPKVVLDFGSVAHLDSAGIESLVYYLSAITRRDGEMKLACLSPQASVILDISRVGRLFEIFPTVEDAVESFEVGLSGAGDFSEPWNAFHASENSGTELPATGLQNS